MRVEALRDVIDEFAEVRLAYVFGSVAAGTARETSDLDIVVLLTFDAKPVRVDQLVTAIEKVSGRTVDRVDLAHAPPSLLMRSSNTASSF